MKRTDIIWIVLGIAACCVLTFFAASYWVSSAIQQNAARTGYVALDKKLEVSGPVDVSGFQGMIVDESFAEAMKPYWPDIIGQQPDVVLKQHYSAYGDTVIICDNVKFGGKPPKLPSDETMILVYDEIPSSGGFVAGGRLKRITPIIAVAGNPGRVSFWVVPKDWENPSEFQLYFKPTTN